MTKSIFTTLALIFGIASLSYSQGKDSSSKGEVFLITEAYVISHDNPRKLNEFVDSSTYITMLSKNDTAFVIGIDHGSIENVILLGTAKKTVNICFNATRNDAEFFKLSYISPYKPEGDEALVFKEYITGSLEKNHAKYYFFNFVFYDTSQFQIYGRLLEEPKNTQ